MIKIISTQSMTWHEFRWSDHLWHGKSLANYSPFIEDTVTQELIYSGETPVGMQIGGQLAYAIKEIRLTTNADFQYGVTEYTVTWNFSSDNPVILQTKE